MSEAKFGFLQLGSGCGKPPGAISGPCFQAFIERKQPGFQRLALTDVKIHAGYSLRATGLILGDLAFTGNPMKLQSGCVTRN